jgi:hypothetical protein
MKIKGADSEERGIYPLRKRIIPMMQKFAMCHIVIYRDGPPFSAATL